MASTGFGQIPNTYPVPNQGRRLTVQELLEETSSQLGSFSTERPPTGDPRYIHALKFQEQKRSEHVISPMVAKMVLNPPIHNFPSKREGSHNHKPYYFEIPQISPTSKSSVGSPTMPLSLQERRERNKVASAKYRAKKHRQNHEMSTQIQHLNSRISGLSAENGLLIRQVQELKNENSELRAQLDVLKSQLVEDKILKSLGRSGGRNRNPSRNLKKERSKYGGAAEAKN